MKAIFNSSFFEITRLILAYLSTLMFVCLLPTLLPPTLPRHNPFQPRQVPRGPRPRAATGP